MWYVIRSIDHTVTTHKKGNLHETYRLPYTSTWTQKMYTIKTTLTLTYMSKSIKYTDSRRSFLQLYRPQTKTSNTQEWVRRDLNSSKALHSFFFYYIWRRYEFCLLYIVPEYHLICNLIDNMLLYDDWRQSGFKSGGAGSLVLDRRRFATMSSYNFFMPFQGAIALKNP